MGFTNYKGSSGMPVLPVQTTTQGNVWYVRPRTGLDGNPGNTPELALRTLSRAHTLAIANQNDIVFLMAESNTAADTTDYQDETLTWSKDLVHLIGIGAPGNFSQRARIAQLSTATGLTNLVTVSADACVFSNFSIFQGVDDATSLVALKVTGTRNYFEGLHVAGIGHATMSAAGAADLSIDGGSENTFKSCTIGLDTITRDADASNIRFDSGASRNWFEDCLIDAYISAATYASVTVADSTGIDRGTYFKKCLFMAKSTNKAVTQTSVFSIPAISQGAIVLQDTYAFSDGGATDWDSNNRGIIWNNSVAAAAGAAGGIMTGQ